MLSPLDDCGLLGGMSAGQVEASDEQSVHCEELCVAADATLQYYEKKYGLQGSAQQSEDKSVSRPGRKRKAKR